MKKQKTLDRAIFIGQHKGSPRLVRPLIDEDGEVAPHKQSLRARYFSDYDARSPRLNYSQLRREIETAVGTDYDALCRKLMGSCRNEATRAEVRDYLDRNIATRTWLGDDGQIFTNCRWRGVQLAAEWEEHYVHPVTRTLERGSYGRWARLPRICKPAPYIALSDNVQLHRIKDIWYEVHLAAIPLVQDRWDLPRDMVTGARAEDAPGLYGRDDVYAANKRQLSHRELVKHGLVEKLAA